MSQARVGRRPEVSPKRSKQPTSAAPKSVSFETTVTATGNNTGIVVPPEVIEELAAGKRPPVLVNVRPVNARFVVIFSGSAANSVTCYG